VKGTSPFPLISALTQLRETTYEVDDVGAMEYLLDARLGYPPATPRCLRLHHGGTLPGNRRIVLGFGVRAPEPGGFPTGSASALPMVNTAFHSHRS